MTKTIDPIYNLATYDYPLDKERIALFPESHRDHSRLEVLLREPGSAGGAAGVRLEHKIFAEIVQYLRAGDLLVMNNTRVMPARLMATKVPTGGRVKVLLLRPSSGDGRSKRWEVLIQGSVSAGQRVRVSDRFGIQILEPLSDGRWLVDLNSKKDLFDLLEQEGLAPLPPYIRRSPDESDLLRYQTIYAESFASMRESGGSVAAPTAGLHFTPELLEKISAQGVKLAFITLHIGPGTFRPVLSSDIRHHRMDPEYYEITKETLDCIRETRRAGGRIIAVGTSTTRTLEAAAAEKGRLNPSGLTDLFISPGFQFKIIDGLVTNFHMPKSTLFMLVSAFTGCEVLKESYAEAIRRRYRLLSYGDAMLIL